MSPLPKPSFAFGLKPDAAIEYLRSKGYKLTFDYQEMMHDAHHKAFTVAKVTRLDLLSDIHGSITDAMKNGTTFADWKKQITPTLESKGWWGRQEVTNPKTGEVKEIVIGGRRLKNIFKTNTRTARATARYEQQMNGDLPYMQYIGGLSEHPRMTHKAKDGIILPKTDPWWNTNYPPNAWGCKCEVRAWSERQIQKRGWSVSTATHENIATPDWSYNPGGGARYKTENVYYKKTLASVFPISDTLKTIDSLVDKNAFKGWVNSTLSDKTYPINETVAGVMSSDVFNFLKTRDIIPDTPHIWLSKKSLTHMIREVKQDKGIALSTVDILGIYDYLQSPSSILFDKEKKNIIYVFDNEKLGKIVVEVNYVSKSGVKNQILTGSILKEIPTGYEVIK